MITNLQRYTMLKHLTVLYSSVYFVKNIFIDIYIIKYYL